MKIALVANTSWNIVNFRRNLILGLIDKGYEVICIAPVDEFTADIQKLPVTFIPINIHAKGNNPFIDFLLLRQFTRIYKNQKPDVIFQYTIKPNIYGTLAARIAGIPTINTVTGLGTVFLHNNLVSKIARKLYAFSFQFARFVVFQNKEDQYVFVQNKIVEESKTCIIRGSGVDTSIFKAASVSPDRHIFRFVMAARLIFDKGITEYAVASKLLHQRFGQAVECVLIGAIDSDKNLGIRKEELDSWIAEHKLIYKPFSKEIVAEYQLATAVVLPSYREGLSKSLLEAASCSKPLIATNVAGCKDVVFDNKNGFLCEVKNAQDLFMKMSDMVKLPKARLNEMGNYSRRLVEENFSDKIIFNDYFCLANEIITKDSR
ncbi:glycosyltransferase family 4 protein [Cytophaga aurantiaca]|uniref:glycosyltransferase family 4 protein n=1 Tax=Cytophaga aurantiaca TaxID=29530 RepID=UPI00037C4061|nr:glycosyltransferase family 4 protein [Cytophaga aurantiaca]